MDCSLGKMPLDYMPYEVAMEYLLSGQGELFTQLCAYAHSTCSKMNGACGYRARGETFQFLASAIASINIGCSYICMLYGCVRMHVLQATNDTENKQVDHVHIHDNESRGEITKFSDQSATDTIVPSSLTIPPRIPDPYLKESIVDFLSRPYPVANVSWTSASGLASVLLDLDFPRVLFTIPAIVNKLNNFAYFRAGIKIGIRVNGTRFHYGKLLCSYIPQFLNSGEDVYSLGKASASPNVILTPTANEVTEMLIPY